MTKWFCRKAAFAMNERWFDSEAGRELQLHEIVVGSVRQDC
jgi:hypothetical protein